MQGKKLVDNVSDIKDFKEHVQKSGELIAESEGKDLGDIYNNIQLEMNSPNPVVAERGLKAAAAFTSKLTQLVLKQTIDIIDLSEKENKILSKFKNFEMKEGNTHEFTISLNTGIENYSDTPFVPGTHTDPQIEVKRINFYKPDGTLGDWSFQWHKMLTLRSHEWTQFFKTNTLSEFIINIRNQMVESIILMKRAKVQKFLKNLAIGKQITGNAANVDCYDSFLELLDHIDTMQFDTNEYCINFGSNDASKNIKAARKSDLLILINKKTLNLLRTGIKARLTNPGFVDLNNVVDADNVIEFYKMIDDTANTSTVITTSNEDVIGANEIKVIDKNALIMINKLEFSGEQLYNTNMALQLDMHYWFMIDYLPWRKALKFTDTKLSVVPQ